MFFLVDISERRQLEEQQLYANQLEIELAKERELADLKSRFTSLVSHEFRTPLSVIQSSIDLLSRYENRLSPEKRQRKIDNIHSQIARMVDLLDDILVLSRNNYGIRKNKPRPVKLKPICRELVERLMLVDNSQHHLDLHFQNVPDIIMLDLDSLNHILTNLLTNSLKYSPANSTIDFSILGQDDHVKFVVKDEGIGIPEKDISRVFDPFHRATNAINIQGTGLGLAIVKQYVAASNGEIFFESLEGEGTTFTVIIPAAEEVDP